MNTLDKLSLLCKIRSKHLRLLVLKSTKTNKHPLEITKIKGELIRLNRELQKIEKGDS